MANQQEEEVLGKAYDARLTRRLLTYLRPYRWQTVTALVAIILKSAADVVGPFITKTAIDKYLAPVKSAPPEAAKSLLSHFPSLARLHWHLPFAGWLSKDPLTGIGQLAGVYVLLQVAIFFLEFVQTYFMQWCGQKVMYDLRSQIFRHLQRMHVAFYDKNPVGRLVTRVTSDVDALNEMFTSGVVSIFEDIFVLGGIIVIMLLMNWWLALITFAVLPFIVVATMIFRKFVRDSYRRIRIAIARINAYLQEHVTGMVVLQLFNRERRAYKDFEKVNASHMEAYKDAILAYALYYPVVELLSSIAIAAVIWYGGGGVLRSSIKIGTLVAFIQYAQRFFRPIQDLSDKYNILQAAMASSERVFKLLDSPVEIVSPERTKAATGAGRIEFRNVWFAYQRLPEDKAEAAREEKSAQDRTKRLVAGKQLSENDSGEHLVANYIDDFDWVLRDVSFVIEPGETVAFVGHTGAGKTTIISLLLRFYDIQRGAITIDGVDVRDLDLNDLRRRFGVVLQDPFLFTGTIKDNIRLGTKHITDEEVANAAENVNVADFINSLPEGYDAEVRERGNTLSTGQKQLISFARALAHNPKILVLDEATSSVDTETELRVREALSTMVAGRTSVIIAHRLSTIQRADKIIVMHKGQVREIGSHQQLLANRGIYWKLYQLQYKDQEVAAPAIGDLASESR